jgi:hypothetical protein
MILLFSFPAILAWSLVLELELGLYVRLLYVLCVLYVLYVHHLNDHTYLPT